MIFLTCIDIEHAFNEIVVVDEATENLLKESLGISFKAGVAQRNGILMRKELVPLIKECLEKREFS